MTKILVRFVKQVQHDSLRIFSVNYDINPLFFILTHVAKYAKMYPRKRWAITLLADTQSITLTGAKILLKTLKRLGTDTIFGYPGGIVLSIYDELFKQSDIKHILVRHEQAAVHAAEGYARASGKCGVVLVTSGPGATNTVTGIANAYLDGFPLVVLTGQVQASLIGRDAFQEVNIIDITKSCTKANYQVTDVNDLQPVLERAFHTAMSGKKGPVVIDLAKNIFTETARFFPAIAFPRSQKQYTSELIKAVISEICSAEKPVIVAGGGVIHSRACEKLKEFAELLNLPVINTMMSLGGYPQDAENYLGMYGIFGSVSANQALKESDLILSVGARFNDRITSCFSDGELSRKFIQIDINEKEISRNIPAYLAVTGDAGEVLTDLIAEFKSNIYKQNPLQSEWLRHTIDFKTHNKINHKISDKIHSFEVIQAISDFVKDRNLYVCTEVGQHQMWTAANFKFSAPGRFITSGGSGTMGFGLPAAIGACVADNCNPVICISGDGSFQMNLTELAVCKDYNLPVKLFILNNGYLGMVRQLQQKFYEGRFSATKISNPDFVKIAEAYGIKGIRAEKETEILPAIRECFETEGPVLVDFNVEPMEVV